MIALKVDTHHLRWSVQQANPRIIGTYTPRDYKRRLRSVLQLERHEMAAAWGGDESELFDTIVRERAMLIEQSREREMARWQQAVDEATRRLRTAEGQEERHRATAARQPHNHRVHQLKADVHAARAALYREELRIATERMQSLVATEVVLLWTR